jgi:Tfp pilus assembly protein PilN
MRPVNLIPPEERRGGKAPLRSGPLSYIVVGALGAALLAVALLVTAGNDIADKKAQVDQLESDLEAATAEAGDLAPFAEFATLRAQREATVASLAQSRFDWERVMRELALVIPEDITLTELNGSAAANAEGSTATTEIGAPNLAGSGCAASHDSVARFIAALEDIDGVTRVGLGRSEAAKGSGTGSSSGNPQLCGDALTFDISIAFDNAVVSPAAAGAAAVPASPTEPAAAPAKTAQNSAAEQTQKAKDAANIIPGAVAP